MAGKDLPDGRIIGTRFVYFPLHTKTYLLMKSLLPFAFVAVLTFTGCAECDDYHVENNDECTAWAACNENTMQNGVIMGTTTVPE